MIHGLLLAAGAGTRMGMPKALVADEGGSWLLRAVGVLLDGGCDRVTVVLGARAEEAARLLDDAPADRVATSRVDRVVAADWQAGMSRSLRAGLTALAGGAATAAALHLVDLPDVPAAAVRRLVGTAGAAPSALARATYGGRPGHPVLLGRDHWAGVLAEAAGDQGARAYLARNAVADVECGDLASGADVDSRGTGGPGTG